MVKLEIAVRCVGLRVAGVETEVWRSADGIPSTNEAYLIPHTPRFQPLIVKTPLSGSGTKCGMVCGLWNAFLNVQRLISW